MTGRRRARGRVPWAHRAHRGWALVVAGACTAAGWAVPARAADRRSQVFVLSVHWSRFSTARVRVAAGTTVRFQVANTDPIAHELIVGDRAVQDRHERGTEVHHGERPGEASVAAGSTASTTVTFDRPASVLFGCHLPGHWAYGMHGVVEVS